MNTAVEQRISCLAQQRGPAARCSERAIACRAALQLAAVCI
ncbi:hypothetical protein [Streptomyces sp. NPDC093089]